MKTQILRLETHDTVTSICDRLAWAQATRILLAFPRRRPPRLGRLEFDLIGRAAARVGSQLAISTVDRKVIEAAKIVGIPVFASIPAAQRLSWRSGSRKRPRWFIPRLPAGLSRLPQPCARVLPAVLPKGVRMGAFTLGVAAFLAWIGLFLPSAVIDIPLATQTQTLDLTVYPGVGIPAVLPGGQIPAREVQTTLEGQLETPVTGEAVIPDQPAEVRLTFTNLTGQTVTVPANTVAIATGTASQRFSTLSAVELAAGNGQQMEVLARAEAPGSAGNVPPGAINALEGRVGLLAAVTNVEPAAGGSDRTARAASQQDYAQLYDRLLTSLTGDALNQLAAENPQTVIVPESLTIAEIVSESAQPAVGQPSDRLRLTLRVAVSGLAVSRADLAAAASAALDASLPAGWSAAQGSLAFTEKTAWVVIPGQRLTLDLEATRSMTPVVNPEGLFVSIRGQTAAQASQAIQTRLGLERAPLIRLSPAWWPRLPLLPIRMKVVTS